jgi:ribosomal protein S18 acetylase RimI-like enzyme
MECKLSETKSVDLERRAPEGYQIRSLSDRDELEAFRSTVNEAFSDTQGFTLVDKEQFKHRYVDRPTFDLGGFLVAVEEGSNSIVGTSAILIEIDNIKKETFGHIKAVGVKEHHRGKGLARHLMLESMKWLTSHGMLVARLGTNNDHAFELYRSLGFKTPHEYNRFEKSCA